MRSRAWVVGALLVAGCAGAAVGVRVDSVETFVARHWRVPLAAQGPPPARFSPLEAAGARADALATACIADDPARAVGAARALVGLGPGLTPAGDDLTGGAFFARALLARAGIIDAAAWGEAAAAVRTAATRLTHPIGVALLGDLLAGEGWAPLHELATALAQEDDGAALHAAARLTSLGHSSGWDLLAGFIIGARG